MEIIKFLEKNKIKIIISIIIFVILITLTFKSGACKESDPPQCKFLGLDVHYSFANFYYSNILIFFILQMLISLVPIAYIIYLYKNAKK